MLHGPDVIFNLKLSVAGAPKNSLSKAILKICLKDKVTGKVYFEKTFKQKNLSPNTPLDFAFTKERLIALLIRLLWSMAKCDGKIKQELKSKHWDHARWFLAT